MRVMLWHWGRRGGGPRFTFELARAMAVLDGVETHLSFSPQAEIADALRGLGLPGLEMPTYTGGASALLASARLPLIRRRFRRYLEDNRIEVVFSTMWHLWNAAVAPTVHAAGARYCPVEHDATAHPGEESRLRAWCLGRELLVADGAVVLSDHVRRRMAAVYGYPVERTRIIPHGAFAFAGLAPARALPQGRPVRLLFFGRILPYKGLGLLLDAYRLLRARFGSRVELVVAGAGDLLPYAGALQGLDGVRLDNRWIGEEEIGPILAGADLLVTPYVEASQSGVTGAAAAAGLPVVATPVGGLMEQVADGETGLLAAAVSADALAAAVAALITDPALYARCSAGALALAGGSLSWASVAGQYRAAAERLRAGDAIGATVSTAG